MRWLTPDYQATWNGFTGQINWVQIDLGKDDHDHLIAEGGAVQGRDGPSVTTHLETTMAKPPSTRAQQASSEQGRTRARHYSAHGAADSRSNFFLGKAETSGREGILIWCADRLQAVKWRNYKVHFYQQETMIAPPVKLPIPFLFNLYTQSAGR